MNRLLRAGLGVPVLVLLLLAMLILPLAPPLLDLLFTFNIALALVVMLVVVYVLRPLDFAAFPTVLLLATLMRLALNVASTRVVLLNGHSGPDAAGQVIQAFGEFVIGGNYAVGLVVFAILVIINFVVVTKGAGRIAEVSARFTLDALPGKQMAIDADLNAGLIDQDDARQRREELVAEADFYGAMDGASKFVRGDAVAGILILVINLLGGLAIGTLDHGLSFGEAVRAYALLTIGDGLAAQVPSLLLSTATAIIVARVTSSQDVGSQILGQLFADPRVLGVTAGVIGVMALIPGMPNLSFFILAAALGGAARVLHHRKSQERRPEPQAPPAPPPNPDDREVTWDDVSPMDVLGLEIGYRLIPQVDKAQGGQLLGRIKGVRRKFSQELGFLIPPVHIRDNLELPPAGYRITLLGSVVGEAELIPGREMAINPGEVFGELDGTPGKDPAFGLDAVWITPDQTETAQTMGYTVVDIGTVIATHLSAVIQRHAADLLGRDEVEELLRRGRGDADIAVTDLVPGGLPLALFHRLLRSLLEEQIPIRDTRTIAEILAEAAVTSQEPDALLAALRVGLSRSIVQQLCGSADEVEVLALAPELERILLNAWKPAEGVPQVLEPNLAEQLRNGLADAAQRQEVSGGVPILLVPPEIRQAVSRFVRHAVSGLSVLAYTEIPAQRRVRVVATVGATG